MPFVTSIHVDIVHQQYDRNITGGMFLHNFSVIFQPPFQEFLSVGQKYSIFCDKSGQTHYLNQHRFIINQW